MAKQKPETKICKHCKTEIPYEAKVCPNCRKKQGGGVLKWIVIVVVVLIAIAVFGSGGSDDNGTKKIGTVGEGSTQADASDENSANDASANTDGSSALSDANESSGTDEVQTEYYVGDILQDGDMKIVYMSSGIFTEGSDYLQPDDGYQYIYLQFAFENTSDDTDDAISSYSFNAYADGYSVDMYYYGDEDLSATLSPGRATTGCVYFIVPEDAETIEVEYTTNYFTEDKITFIYEGEKDSGYTVEKDTAATEGVYVVGDIIEVGDMVITYISCEEYTSDDMFDQPADGYHYITCTFEFENNGDSDEYVSYYDFDCYADGLACGQYYFREDGLADTISSGHKAQGTVTFEVPDDATTIEAEYVSNYWTSSRVVFTCAY